LPDGSSVKDTIPMEILSTAIEVPPTEHSSRFGILWLLLIGFLLLAIIVLVFRSMKKPAKQQVKQESYIEPPAIDASEPRQVSPRLTQVGGYNFHVPTAQNPTVTLIGVSGPVEGQQFPVEKEIFYIGADEENDLPIPEDEYVSGMHAFLQYEHGTLLIFDRGSQNGTFVNEEPVTDTGVALNLGDRIRLGNSSFDVEKEPR
jgi:pSer/pThr/pTyr-binding forkhead associated (FHA) protein